MANITKTTNINNRNKKSAATAVRVASGMTKATRKAITARPNNRFLDYMLGLPEKSACNPKGMALQIGVVRKTVPVQLDTEGTFVVHPVLGQSLTIDAAETPFSFNTELVDGYTASILSESAPNGFLVQHSGASSVGSSHPVYSASLGEGSGDFQWMGPVAVDGKLVNIGGHKDLPEYYDWRVVAVVGTGGRTRVTCEIDRTLIAGESIQFHLQKKFTGGSTSSVTINTMNAGANSIPASAVDLNMTTSVIGFHWVAAVVLKSPVRFLSMRLDIEGDAARHTDVNSTTRSIGVGLGATEFAAIRGLVDSGRVAVLGIQFWMQWIGTMQQNGELAMITLPASDVGALALSRERIVALQKSGLTAYNGELNKGVIGFLCPVNGADYGTPDVLGSFVPAFKSMYGAYSTVSTASSGALPRLLAKWQIVLGFVPTNPLLMQPLSVYSPGEVQMAIQFFGEFAAIHENSNHKKTMKTALKVADTAVKFGLDWGPTILKMGKMLASFAPALA